MVRTAEEVRRGVVAVRKWGAKNQRESEGMKGKNYKRNDAKSREAKIRETKRGCAL